MLAATALREGLRHPQAEAWLRFNLLPSQWLHASRREALLPPAFRELLPVPGDVLHRHWSGLLLKQLDVPAVASTDEPALPLCLAPQVLFDALVLHAGLLPLAGAVRRLISRDEVALVAAQVGPQALAFAREAAGRIRSGEVCAEFTPAQCLPQAVRLGHALLSLAFDTASPALAARARLRLPADAATGRSELTSDISTGPAALNASLAVVAYLDPAWLSSFPARP